VVINKLSYFLLSIFFIFIIPVLTNDTTEYENFKLLLKEMEEMRKEFQLLREDLKGGKLQIKQDSTKSIQPPVKEKDSKEEVVTKPPKKYQIQTKGLKLQEVDESNTGNRYAIVVGINNYQDAGISALSKARNDAKIVGKILKDQGQFDQIFIMTDDVDPRSDKEKLYPTKLNIEEKLDSVLRFAQSEDLFVFFFSGHGISDPEENGFLVTVDTVTDKQFYTSLSVESIVNRFKKKGLKKTLLVLDACRDVLYSSKSSSRNSILEKDDSEVAATFYSTKSGYYSYEDDETDYGVFTKYLVMGMEGKADANTDGVIAFSELEQYVQKGVKEWSTRKNKQQKPYTRLHGERTGDLVITFSEPDKKSLVDKPVPRAITRGDMIFRSSFFPGWGQYYAGSKTKGLSYMAINLGLLGFFANQLSDMRSAQGKYDSAIVLPGTANFIPSYILLQQERGNLSESGGAVMSALGLVSAFWLYNIIDAGTLTEIPKQDIFSFGVYKRSFPIDHLTQSREKEEYGYFQYTWRF
jgi:hypothetical protein